MSVALYAATVFVSAFLLFGVQPIIAKAILPWFGGTAGVWTTSLLFFQAVLLLGYAYAHASMRLLPPRRQALLHLVLLAASAIFLPIVPSVAWKPHASDQPIARILGVLAGTVGMPYFMLSTTGPLLQAWFVRAERGAFPYRLFALSNFGSMLGLLSYPFWVEPAWATHAQELYWSMGYGLFLLLVGAVTVRAWRADGVLDQPDAEAISDPPPGGAQWALWIALSACPSMLLLAVTNHITQNIAALPFIWVAELALYLLTFVLCFESDRWYQRWLFVPLTACAFFFMTRELVSSSDKDTTLRLLVGLFSFGLFTACMLCNGELARSRPHPRHLTAFYLAVSLGGAIGGLLVAIGAPCLLNGNYELQIGMFVTALVAMVTVARNSSGRAWKLVALALVIASGWMARSMFAYALDWGSDAVVQARNFYGALSVRDEGTGVYRVATLIHGTIIHGKEFLEPNMQRIPTTYYVPTSGVGLAVMHCHRDQPQRIGVIGLGCGTVSAYARRQDHYRFYDINPLVVKMAHSQFFFLPRCPAPVEVVLGDARLSLEGEPPQNLDVLAVDAFSGDSIPVHLLTREAFQLYFHHLKPDGILAVHISNKYLDLQPVVTRAAADLGRQSWLVDDEKESDEDQSTTSNWMLVGNNPSFFSHAALRGKAVQVSEKSAIREWTDDYSNLIEILRK